MMRILSASVIDKVLIRTKGMKPILFLDYDGTLTPIVNRPEHARLAPVSRKTLSVLANNPQWTVVVISGRKLADIKKRVGIKGLIYVGNHGLEMEGCGVRFLHPQALKTQKVMRLLVRRLNRKFAGLSGIQVEDKVYTLSIHYRRASSKAVLLAQRLLCSSLTDVLKKGSVSLTHGKKVWEVRPKVDWNKGTAVDYLRKFLTEKDNKTRTLFYFGDDVTDESAFKTLRRRGLTVRITRKPQEPTAAKFYLRNSAGVIRVLKFFSKSDLKGRKV